MTVMTATLFEMFSYPLLLYNTTDLEEDTKEYT